MVLCVARTFLSPFIWKASDRPSDLCPDMFMFSLFFSL